MGNGHGFILDARESTISPQGPLDPGRRPLPAVAFASQFRISDVNPGQDLQGAPDPETTPGALGKGREGQGWEAHRPQLAGWVCHLNEDQRSFPTFRVLGARCAAVLLA